MKIKILDKSAFGEDTPIERLNDFGEVEVYSSTSENELVERCKDAEVLILNKVKIGKEVFETAEKLKLVCLFATGYDNVDIAEARKHNVAVCNVPGYSTDSVALFTVTTVLSLLTHIKEYNRYVTEGAYTNSGVPNKLTPVYHEISGLTWGIIGCGNIGKRVARVAEALGAKVLVNKRTPDESFNCVDIDTLCKESDIITIHCPLNEGTRGIINASRIELMKKNVIIVNEARGAVIDEYAIAEAIIAGKISAFGSDVYSVEPFGKDHPFYKIKNYDNVLLTPHAAWGAYEARVRCLNIICDNIASFIEGKTLNRVDI